MWFSKILFTTIAIFTWEIGNAIPDNQQFTNNNLESRIVGGSRVKHREDFPYQVSLRIRGQHICGGTIYKAHYVITAAHCLVGLTARHLEVVAGDLSIKRTTSQTQTIKVSSLIVHENYTQSIKNDVAILKLKQDFKFNNYVKDAPVWNASTVVEGVCLVSGWGSTYYDGPVVPDMRFATIKVFSASKCLKIYPASFLPPGMLCAGDVSEPKDACSGDSGGPLICNGSLYGIVSWGIDCGKPHLPGVYTNASHYLEWIDARTSSGLELRSINVSIYLFVLITIKTILK